jgi:hypothetical protein
MASYPIPPQLGGPVSTRQFNLLELVSEKWGGEFRAPDRNVYVFSNGRGFNSSDQGTTGIYKRPGT